MHKFLRRTLKILKIVVLVIVLLYAGLYIYISANKKKLIADLTDQAGKKLNGRLQIGDADISIFRTFPQISVLIKNISLTDTMFAVHKHAFFTAQALYAKLGIMNLLTGKQPVVGIRVDNGSFYLFRDTSGFSNMYLLETKKDPAGGPKRTDKPIQLRDIELRDVHITQDDRPKQKLLSFEVHNLTADLVDKDKILTLQSKLDVTVDSLAFNMPRGVFLPNARVRGTFPLHYGTLSQLLSFDSINVNVSGQQYNLTGTFDLGKKDPLFSMRVHARNAYYNDVKKLMPVRIDSSLSMVSLDRPLDADAELHGPLLGGDPYVMVRWRVQHSRLATPFMDFDDASFAGYYDNEVTTGLPRKDPNSIIAIDNFTASWHGLPVTSGKIEILNLAVPQLTVDLHSAFPLMNLNSLVQTRALRFTGGKASVNLGYKGPMERNNNTNSFLNGYVSFADGSVLYVPRDVEMKNVKGNLVFQNSNVSLQNIQCSVLGNTIIMNGTANNLLTLINTAPNAVHVSYNIYSPSLNLRSFTYLLKNDKPAAVQKPSAGFGSMTDKIDALLEESNIDVSFRADKLLYKNFAADHAAAEVQMLQDRYLIKTASMDFGSGKMSLTGAIVTNSASSHEASVKASLTNVNVNRLFASFENFGQTAIKADNIAGNLTSDISASLLLGDDGAVLPASANGAVTFSLKHGTLNNFEPIKKVQRFVFKKRDFDNIDFAELKDRLDIKNGEITINRMEIESSVLSLFVEGLYSQRGNTDISIQVPFSNLKKRGDDFRPENIGADEKGGRSIYLRGRPGKDGNIDFKLDLFKHYQKDHS